MQFPALAHPIVQAPLAGGPSTPELAAAVSGAGGLGFLAAGYRTAEDLGVEISRVRASTSAPFGVNVFVGGASHGDAAAVERYAQRLAPEAVRLGLALGEPRVDDDALEAKLDVLVAERPAVVSTTFGCPSREVVDQLHAARVAVWVTVTEADEAVAAGDAGADALVVQGVEAGGHRATFDDLDGRGEVALLPLLQLVAHAVDLPLVAAGGIANGVGVAAVLAAGARAAQIGTGFLLCPEAGTSAPHREALRRPGETRLTRAFTGRRARGIVNRFLREHDLDAPSAYPQVHHLTAPLRAAARASGDAAVLNLWAGEAFPLAEAAPAAELVRRWSAEAHASLVEAAARA